LKILVKPLLFALCSIPTANGSNSVPNLVSSQVTGVEATDLMSVVMLLEEEAGAAFSFLALFLTVSYCVVIVVRFTVHWITSTVTCTTPISQVNLVIARALVYKVSVMIAIKFRLWLGFQAFSWNVFKERSVLWSLWHLSIWVLTRSTAEI